MSVSVSAFRLTARRVKAAQLVAEDALTDIQIAAKVGISERQLERWKRQPAFAPPCARAETRRDCEFNDRSTMPRCTVPTGNSLFYGLMQPFHYGLRKQARSGTQKRQEQWCQLVAVDRLDMSRARSIAVLLR
jgi:hypothetical protein